jgi:hypothetical protein
MRARLPRMVEQLVVDAVQLVAREQAPAGTGGAGAMGGILSVSW